MKHELMAAGAAVSAAGMVVGVFIALAGGQDTGRPLGAAPVRAQRVDLNSPSADPSANSQETTHDVTIEVSNIGAYVGGVCVLDDENKSCNASIINNLFNSRPVALTAKVPSGQSTIQVQGWAFNGQFHKNINDFPNAVVTVDATTRKQCFLFDGDIVSFSFKGFPCAGGS